MPMPTVSLVTTDDCGLSPFADDTSTSRGIAFAKVKSRVEETAIAAWAPTDPDLYRENGKRLAEEGYVQSTARLAVTQKDYAEP